MLNDTQQSQSAEVADALPEPEREAGFQRLDPRAIKLWQTSALIFVAVMMFISLMGVGVVGWTWTKWLPWLIAGWVGLGALGVWFSLARPARYYRAWGYRLDDRVLETRSGILFQRTRLLPLSRLQHVDIERGPLERMYGLASLVLHTAGTHSASLRIPGLAAEEALRLRNHLIEIGGDDAV